MSFGRKNMGGIGGQAAAGVRGLGHMRSSVDRDAEAPSAQLQAFLNAERANRPVDDHRGGLSESAVNYAPARHSAQRDRSMIMAYVWWYFCSPLAAHRFYLRAGNSAWVMLGLFWGGLAAMLVWAPIGVVMIASWFLWAVVDIALIPGMHRRCGAPTELAATFR